MRATSRARSAVKIQRGLRGSRSAAGVLNYKHVHARLVRGSDPVFRGRVALDRGAGVVEFPSVQQFRRIAQQEGVPKELVDRAFGAPAQPRRQSRRQSRRRTSRAHRPRRASRPRQTSRQPGVLARLFGLSPNSARKTIRRDLLHAPTKLDGSPIALSARTVNIPDEEVERFGAARGVYMDLGGQVVVLPYQHASLVAREWVGSHDFYRSFGHLKGKGVLGQTPQQSIPTTFGPRTMKLGHYSEGFEQSDRGPIPVGVVRPGIAKGQLVLYHKPTGSVMWMAFDDEDRDPKKPILIRLPRRDGDGYKQKNFPINKAFSGAKIGTGESAEMVSAVDRGIPPMAMLTAFDHLLSRDQRRHAYELFSKPGPPPEG
jgi:hypothetical protein